MPEQRWGPKASTGRVSEPESNLTWQELVRMNMHFRDENDRLRERIEDLEQKAYETSAREAKAKLDSPKRNASGWLYLATWVFLLAGVAFVLWK